MAVVDSAALIEVVAMKGTKCQNKFDKTFRNDIEGDGLVDLPIQDVRFVGLREVGSSPASTGVPSQRTLIRTSNTFTQVLVFRRVNVWRDQGEILCCGGDVRLGYDIPGHIVHRLRLRKSAIGNAAEKILEASDWSRQ